VSIQLGDMSPDGRYKWDGHAWQLVTTEPSQVAPQPIAATAFPVRPPDVQRVEMRAGAAFRLGFWAFFGAGCASLAFWALILIGAVLLGVAGIGLGSLGRHP
jgi:hypothetical protein